MGGGGTFAKLAGTDGSTVRGAGGTDMGGGSGRVGGKGTGGGIVVAGFGGAGVAGTGGGAGEGACVSGAACREESLAVIISSN